MKAPVHIHPNISENDLIAGLLNDDQDCFSGIYEIYAARIYGQILKWVKKKEIAEILLRNAFVKAWHGRNLFDEAVEHLFCWLCRLARICYNEYTATGNYETV